jgi:hypothetical protein
MPLKKRTAFLTHIMINPFILIREKNITQIYSSHISDTEVEIFPLKFAHTTKIRSPITLGK